MLNLFLAILLGNFDKARSFWLKKNIFEMFETAIERKYKLSKAINIILGDVNKTVKDELLVHDPKDIFRLNGRLMIINRKLMENDNEAQDKLVYYDRVAAFENEYKPIIEFNDDDAFEDELESEGEGEIEKSIEKLPEDKTLKVIPPEDESNLHNRAFEENHLNKSAEGLVFTKKNSDTRMLRTNKHPFIKPALVTRDVERTFAHTRPDAVIANRPYDEFKFDMQPNSNIPVYVTLGTPREKVDDLEEYKEEAYPDTKRKLTKSVTFDMEAFGKLDSQNQKFGIDKSPESESSKSEELKKIDEVTHEYFSEDNIVQVTEQPPLWKKILRHMMHSSLFIFHRDWRFRKYLIALVVSPETYNEYMAKKKENAAYNDDQKADIPKVAEVEEDQRPNKTFKVSYSNKLEEDKEDDIKLAKSFNKSESKLISKKSKEDKITDSDVYQMLKFSKNTRHPSKYFDYTIIVLILLSSFMLIADNPLNDPNSQYSKTLEKIDFVFTFLFFLEAVIKIIALGFFFSSITASAYITNGWNILDFIVVSASLVDFFVLIQNTDSVDTQQLKSLKALRALRALRPLRMISRNEGMRLVVNALFASIPSMTNVLIVCLLFILIFASTGISFFAGTFYYCDVGPNDSVSASLINLDNVNDVYDCINYGGQWINQKANFDNIFTASLTLFEMMTTEGWLDVMYNGVDARGIDLQPKKNNNVIFSLFFIAFMVVGSMLIFNLFVGVVIDNFNKIKTNEELGNMFVTESQKKWIEIQRIIMRKKLKLQEQKPTKG